MGTFKKLARMAFALGVVLIAGALVSHSAVAASACDNPAETKKIIVNGDWLAWAIQGPIYQSQPRYNDYYAAEGLEVQLFSPGRTPSSSWPRGAFT